MDVNEKIVRDAYQVAEVQDVPGWMAFDADRLVREGAVLGEGDGRHRAHRGKAVKVPCCDVFRVRNGKIASFNCHPSGTVLFGQLGVLTNLEAVLDQ
ncbi:nuclear transport factor 2 family protein [Streptomyces olivaceoviridis]|uniref:nuclear transport factor 2 family protein n=1 Tax=Streptomyces olivaceoviridis TaxID=1921 RepID=UPI0036AAA5A2